MTYSDRLLERVNLENVFAVEETTTAIEVENFYGDRFWIPKSQIDMYSFVRAKGDVGILIINIRADRRAGA